MTRAQERVEAHGPGVEAAVPAATSQKPVPPAAEPDHQAATPKGWIQQLKGIGGLVALA